MRHPRKSAATLRDMPQISRQRGLAVGMLMGTVLIASCSSSPHTGKPDKNRETLLSEKACASCDLTGVDLSQADLSNADLSDTNLQNANLAGANLKGTSLKNAELVETNFQGANLQNALLSYANFSRTNFSGANLDGAILSPAFFQGTIFQNASLRGVDLSNVSLSDANLSGADLTGANLEGTLYQVTDLTGANLNGAQGFDLAKIQKTSLTELKLDDTTTLPNGETYDARADPAIAQETPSFLPTQLSDEDIVVACEEQLVVNATPYNAEALQGRTDVVQSFSTRLSQVVSAKPYQKNSSYIPSDWQARNNPALVLCATEMPQAELLEICDYGTTSGQVEGRRYRSQLELKLVETATAKVLASQTFSQDAKCDGGLVQEGETIMNHQVDYFEQSFEEEIAQFVQPHAEKFK